MANCGWQKGVSRWGAPFALYLLCLGLALPSAAAPLCGTKRYESEGVVEYVYDGDTLRLADGRKIRVIGINTPEIGREGKPSEPVAERARQAARQLAGEGTRVRLTFGAERRDHYGRTLAHVYLPDGSSLSARLLEKGMGTTLVVPPNTLKYRCYRSVEDRAREAEIGVWKLNRYKPAPAGTLRTAQGYRLVTGVVERVGESRSSIWLNLRGGIAVRIPRADLKSFSGYDPRQLAGREILARGWLHQYKGEPRMTVRHPAALELAD